MSRADKLEATRKALFAAAARVVGQDGYADASVAKITALADVAQGTFYNYFASQQDLFDQLLPALGEQLLDRIRERLAGIDDDREREELRFRIFFDYVRESPEFYRILNEAEVISPKAYADHMTNMADSYVRAMGKSIERGAMAGFERRELEVVAYILLAARNYLAYRYTYRNGDAGPLPEWVVRTYMRFVAGGLGMDGADGGGKPRRRPKPGAPSDTLALVESGELRVLTAARDQAAVELPIRKEHRDGRGRVHRVAVLGLLDAAAGLAAGTAVEPVSVSTQFLAPTSAPLLFVRAHRERREGSLIHVSVRASELDERGPAVATGQMIFARDTTSGGKARR